MGHQKCAAVLALLGCFWGSAASSADRNAPPPRTLRHSDVVFMCDDPKQYEPYGCTVLGWAGWAGAKHIEEAHANGVGLFATSVGFLTESSRVIDFSPDFLDAACRNFEGRPFAVPWLWDQKHKGQPAWWWCTNSPLYRKSLKMRLVEVMKAQPDGLHIDDYRGTSGAVTWLSACFCRHCMAGFREYLGKAVPKEKLAALRIKDLDGFDYRQFLLNRGVKPEDYQKRRASLPLAAEFLDFQVKANTAFVADYRHQAEGLAGHALSLCVNSGLDDAQSLTIAPRLSYFCCEVDHAASSRALPMHPVYVYKLADGLDRPVAATASGWDWAYVAEHNLPGLVRTWIALSYAYGHNFMAPHHQWCYTTEKGTHWYNGPAEQYAWLYQFVRRSARLLDGYEAVAPVAVVYDNASRRQGRGDIQPICAALAERNTPFTVVVAGDDWLDYRLDARRLDGFRAVIVTKDLALDGGQRKLIEKVRAEDRLVVWPGHRGAFGQGGSGMTVWRVLICTACALAFLGCSQHTWAAAPHRVSIGNGSGYLRYDDAQASLKLQPGDTLYINPGTYSGLSLGNLSGTAANPITVTCDPTAVFTTAVPQFNNFPNIAHLRFENFRFETYKSTCMKITGNSHDLLFRNFHIKDASGYSFHVYDPAKFFDGTKESTFYNFKWENVVVDGKTDGAAICNANYSLSNMISVLLDFEVYQCTFRHFDNRVQAFPVIGLERCFNLEVHECTFSDIGMAESPIGHNVCIAVAGYLRAHGNRFARQWANDVRMWPMKLNALGYNGPQAVNRFYNNISWEKRKYPMYEHNHVPQADMDKCSGYLSGAGSEICFNTLYRPRKAAGSKDPYCAALWMSTGLMSPSSITWLLSRKSTYRSSGGGITSITWAQARSPV